MTDSDAGNDRPEEAERRDYYRVDTCIPIRIRSLDSGEVERVAVEIAGSRDVAPAVSDPVLAVILQRLEHKLDLILSHLDERHPPPLESDEVRSVSLSGCGVGLDVDEEIDLEDEVLLEFVLPGDPNHCVRALARPVVERGAEENAKQKVAAFSFDVISDADRDAIVRFSHEMQRAGLRARSREPIGQ